MKNKNTLIIVLAISTIIALVFAVLVDLKVKDNNSINKDNTLVNQYKELSENTVFREIQINEVFEFLEKGTGLIMFGFPECSWCQGTVPLMDEASRELNIDTIYYYNIREIRKNNTQDYQKIITYLKDYLSDDENNNPRVYVPDIYVVKNGKILGHNNDLSMNTESSEGYFTEEIKTNQRQKYYDLFRNLK